MKKLRYFILLCILPNSLFAQNNLVQNYSFELDQNGNYVTLSNCGAGPANDGYCPTVGSSLTPGGPDAQFTDMLNFWNEIYGWTCPDRRTICDFSNYIGVGSADIPCNLGPRTGLRSESGNLFEHALSELLYGGMITGHSYYWEYYVKAEPDEPNVGIRLFEDKPKQCGYQKISDNDPPQLKAPDNYLSTTEWKKVSGFINPDKNYKWIGLGRFGYDNNDQGGRTNFDDLKIYDLGTEQCPSKWLFENTVFQNEHRIYQASDKIIAGEDVDGGGINGPVIVKSNSNVIFKAANQVILEPGFSTENGAYFETVIEPCSQYLCPLMPPAINDAIICDDNPIAIGNAGAETGLYYSWSPSTYLNDPNSPNPIFTPPGGSGFIDYTVTITSICGYLINFNANPPTISSYITNSVNVYYNDNPDPNPTVAISNIQTSEYDFNFDFTVGAVTEEYCIQIIEQGTGAIAFLDCFEVAPGSCCNFNFNFDELSNIEKNLFSTCKDYTIKVIAKNYCSENLTTDEFDWNRNENLNLISISNIITIPDDPNEYFTCDVEGADNFHVVIFNPSGGEVHNQFGKIYDAPLVLWDGWCDGANCSLFFGQECWVINGTYFYTLELSSDCGGQFNTSGNITVFHDYNNLPCVRSTLVVNDSTINTNQDLMNEILIYPNPSNGLIEIKFPTELELDKIFLYDNTGRLVFETENSTKEMDLSSFSNGIYFIELNTDQGIFREKIIKQ